MRVEKLQAKLKEQNLDALMVTNPFNLRYVSHFTGTAGLAVLTQEKAFFVTDFRYTEQANEQAKGFEIIRNIGSIYEEVAKLVKSENIEKLGFEQDVISYATFTTLEEIIECELVPVSGFVESLREIKDQEEIDVIQKAIKITEAAYQHILKEIKPGMTELEVANKLDFFMREQGASSVSFDTIVASGVRSALPHGVASDKVIEQGDMITIDFGCYYNGYVSDMTRTFALGDPGEKLKEVYEIVREAHARVNSAVKAGMTGAEVDAIARDYITEKGYGEAFGHSTGHGIGLEVHEGPSISFKNDKKLVPGNAITNEPGIYLPGIGGVRIEDDLLVTEDGNKNLMSLPTDLIIL